MSQHPEPSAPDYLPVSLVAEMAYCPRNFYYRMVEAWDDVTSADMLKGKGPRPGDLAGQVLTPRDLGRTLYVDEQGACVRKRQGQLVVEKHGERILAVPLTLAKAFVASKLTNMRVRIQRTRRSRDMPKLKAADGQLLDALDGVLWRVRSFHSKEGGKARAIARRRLHAMSSAFQRSGRPRSCARQARGATGCAPAATIAFKQPVEGASVVLHALRAIALGRKASSPSTSPATRHSPPANDSSPRSLRHR